MKATVSTQALLEGLNVASNSAATRTPKPALQAVLVTVEADSLLLMTTDLEIGTRYRITQIETEQPGQALVPVAKLTQIIRESTDETVELELDGTTLHIRGSDAHFRMFSGDAKDFPPVPDLDGKPDFVVSAQQLKNIVDKTLFAAAKESTRYAIDGLLWDRQGGVLKVIATDGRRLAVASCELTESDGDKNSAIVPSKAMSLFSRVNTDPEERYEIKFLPNQLLVKGSRATLSTVLVEGHFPPYEDVVPHDCDCKATANVAELLSGVRRAALLTSEESKAIRLSFASNQVVMTGRAPEQGEASVQVPLEFDGHDLEIGFNPAFLVDVLKATDNDSISFELKEANRPGVFRNGSDYLYVVMPVNLS